VRDELQLSSRNDEQIVLTCTDPDIPTDNTNLIVRAAYALRKSAGRSLGADVHLVKRIPVQAGLGGASSNAAAALLGLSKLWGLPTADLKKLAGELGADVPFFLVGGRAIGRGIGTDISPLPDEEPTPLIIVSPNARIATASAYNAVDARSLTSNDAVSILAGSSAEPVTNDWHHWPLQNDFESVIFDIEPEIERAKSALLEAGARAALLAGSGSSVFGIFATEAARQSALECLKLEPGWRVFSCETVSRDDFHREITSGLKQLR